MVTPSHTGKPTTSGDANQLRPLGPDEDVHAAFADYWSEAGPKAFADLCAQEGADPARLEGVMQRMLFTGREPGPSEVVEALIARPKLMERKGAITRLLEAARRFVGVYDEGVGDLDGN